MSRSISGSILGVPGDVDVRRSMSDRQFVLAGAQVDTGANAVPLVQASEFQCGGPITRTPVGTITEQLAQRDGHSGSIAKIEFRAG